MRPSYRPPSRSAARRLRRSAGPSRRTRRWSWPHLLVPLVVALFAAFLSLGLGLEAHSLRHGLTATGTVRDRSDSKDSVDVTVDFATAGGEQQCDTTHVDGDPQVGEQVDVRYARDDPSGTCAVGRAGQSYLPSASSGAVALVAAGRVSWVLLRRRRLPRSSEEDLWTDTW